MPVQCPQEVKEGLQNFVCQGQRVRYLVKPKMGFLGSFRKGSAHLRPRGRARAVGKSEESGVQRLREGSSQPSQLLQRPPCTWGLGTAMPTAAEATMHMGSGKGVLSVQVAQGGEEVVSESKTEDSG